MSYNTEVQCPGCGEPFTVRTHMLEDDLGVPIDEDELTKMHDCPNE